jgi:hypothetical protein
MTIPDLASRILGTLGIFGLVKITEYPADSSSSDEGSETNDMSVTQYKEDNEFRNQILQVGRSVEHWAQNSLPQTPTDT